MTLLEKKKAYYKRMETDFEFRMNQVDKKIQTMNALSGYDKYMRYQLTLIEHDITGQLVNEYMIGIYGQCTLIK